MTTHTRAPSSLSGAPHALSLKVLRLSRPSLATQTPLPATSFSNDNGLDIPSAASLAYPGAEASFPLTPLLTLPSAFGAAYVGETFACTLCVNCEGGDSGDGDGAGRSVSAVRVEAELQTPGREEGVGLALRSADAEEVEDEEGEDSGEMRVGETRQYTVAHELKEQGPHVLAVTVGYTETLAGGDEEGAGAARTRTFRKLYQFVAQPLIAVRSKVTELKRRGLAEGKQWVLEAQLENVGETLVVLERVWVTEREGIVGTGRVGMDDGGGREHLPVLKPQDVEQVMFALREEKRGVVGEGRVPLAQVHVKWRSAMGEQGGLTTGWLASRPK